MKRTGYRSSDLPLCALDELEIQLPKLGPAIRTEGDEHSWEVKGTEVNDIILTGRLRRISTHGEVVLNEHRTHILCLLQTGDELAEILQSSHLHPLIPILSEFQE